MYFSSTMPNRSVGMEKVWFELLPEVIRLLIKEPNESLSRSECQLQFKQCWPGKLISRSTSESAYQFKHCVDIVVLVSRQNRRAIVEAILFSAKAAGVWKLGTIYIRKEESRWEISKPVSFFVLCVYSYLTLQHPDKNPKTCLTVCHDLAYQKWATSDR